MELLRTLIVLALVFVATACTKQIEFTGEDSDPMPVLVSYTEADSTFNVRLTYSRFFLSNREFKPINDASFSFEVNGGTPHIAVERIGEGYYHIPLALRAGDTMTLRVTVPGEEEEVWAGCRVPSAPEVSDILVTSEIYVETCSWEYDYTDSTVTQYATGSARFSLVLHDAPAKGNYYAIRAYAIDSATGTRTPLTVSVEDDVLYDMDLSEEFIDLGSDVDLSYGRQALFTDDRINGQNHTIEGCMRLNSEYDSTFTVQLQVCSLSRDAYLYWATLKAQETNNDDDFFFISEPVQIHTNVEGGIGILGAVTPRRLDALTVSFSHKIKDPRK